MSTLTARFGVVGVAEHVVLEPRPERAAGVEIVVLRACVGEVERVVVRRLGDHLGAPRRVEPAHEVAAVERVVAVDGLAGLLVAGSRGSRIQLSLSRCGAPAQLAVDVHGGEQRERAPAVHDDAEVVVAQLRRRERREAGPGHGQRDRWARNAGS